MEVHEALGLCSHCGSDSHDEDHCTVKQATNEILANWEPRGMTTGADCPNCGRDGTFHWGPESKTFICECGHEVPTSHGRGSSVKAYVAGRTSDVETVRKAQQIVRDAGGEITFDWTGENGEIRPDLRPEDVVPEDRLVQERPHPFDGHWETTLTHTPTGTTVHASETTKLQAHQAAMKELRKQLGGWADDPEKACEIAEQERQGVKNADVVIAIYKDGRGLGKIIEIGMALMARKRVILVGPFAESVFWYMPKVERVADLEELRGTL